MTTQTKNILQSTGIINKIPEEKKEALIPKLGDLLEKRMIVSLSVNIPEENKVELQQKLNDNDPDVTDFLQSKIPNCAETMKHVIDKFKNEVEQMI